MSTTDTERHCRLCLMLNKGGTQACHHLLLKRVKELCPKDHDPYPWTVQQFLDTQKQTIIKSKLSKDKFKILFPNDGDTVLTNWDLSLFCTVLTLYCDLKPIMRLDVEQLRNLRNELCHMNEPNISVSDYKDKLEMIQVIICRLVKKIDEQNVKIEIENVIKNLESATLSLDETLKEMHAFYMMEMNIREKLDHVEERILQKLEQFDDKWEFISKVLGEKEDSRINTATNNCLVPGVNIYFDLKNVSDEEEANMSDVLQQLFDEVIHEDNDFKSSIPADSYVKLRGAIKKTFKRFLSKGWRITGVKHECIQLHIECENFTALASMFREQTHGLIDQQLTDLNDALNECVCEKMLLLETTIYKDELWNVIDKAISCVADVLKKHNIDMTNQSDNAKLLGEERRKHSLSLSAEKVGSEGSWSFEGDCNNKLATFLQLLKAELKSEFHTPNLLIQANCSTNVNHESNDSSIENKVELLEEQENTQTIESDHQSPKYDKKEKENIKLFKAEEGEYVEKVFEGLSLKVEKEEDLHNNALHAVMNSVNAISVYFELASLTLFERNSKLWDNIYLVMKDVRRTVDGIFTGIADTADIMHDMLYRSALYYTGLMNFIEDALDKTEQLIEQTVTHLNTVQYVQDHETLLWSKVPVEQMKNQSKAGYDHLKHLQQLCKDEERLLKEWQRNLKDRVPLSKEETKQGEEVEDANIQGDKIQFLGTQLAGDKKVIYDDLGTSKMLTQDKIRPSQIHLRHAKDMALNEYGEKTQQTMTEMLRPSPALLIESTDLTFDEKKIKSYYNILVSDPLFERDSNIVEDIKAFLSELTSYRETKLIEDTKQEGKIEQASSLSIKQPSEDELKRSISLNQKKGTYLKESGTISVQDKEISTSVQLLFIGQDKQHWTESLQLRGRRIALWCMQRVKTHSECMTVQMKRIQISLSRIHTILLHIESKTTIPKSLDRSTLKEEWSKVEQEAQHCKRANDSFRGVFAGLPDNIRENRLRSILKELETLDRCNFKKGK